MTASDKYHQANIDVGQTMFENDSAAATIPTAMHNQVEDWVALELTAEEMAKDEVMLVSNYVAEDAKGFWGELKGGIVEWELEVCDLLLSAADPTRVEWHKDHWWNDNPAPM